MLRENVGEFIFEVFEFVQLGEFIQAAHYSLLSVLTLVFHVVNVELSLDLILSVLFGPLASVPFEECFNIDFDKSAVGHPLRLHHLDPVQLLQLGAREDHTPTVSCGVHWVALKFKDHKVLTGETGLQVWYLFDEVVAEVQESQPPEMHEALNPLDLVAV